jgi:phosphohistidine phosphatase
LQALAEKLPTAGLAVLAFDADAWSDVDRGHGRLKLLTSPKRLPSAIS